MPYKIKVPQLLVASPLLDDPEFSRTIILVTNHDPDKGSVAFVITRKMAMLPDYGEALLNGGPVSVGQYFVTIHSRDFEDKTSADIGGKLFLSSMADVFSEVLLSGRPKQRVHFTGYAGFAPGELEEEVNKGLWLPIEFDKRYLFEIPSSSRWEFGLAETGIVDQSSHVSNVVHVEFGNKEVM